MSTHLPRQRKHQRHSPTPGVSEGRSEQPHNASSPDLSTPTRRIVEIRGRPREGFAVVQLRQQHNRASSQPPPLLSTQGQLKEHAQAKAPDLEQPIPDKDTNSASECPPGQPSSSAASQTAGNVNGIFNLVMQGISNIVRG